MLVEKKKKKEEEEVGKYKILLITLKLQSIIPNLSIWLRSRAESFQTSHFQSDVV